MSDQPEALRLADDRPSSINDDLYQWAIDAEDMIRSQHAEIERLREYADTLVRERNAAWAESAELRRRAELFDALQNMPVEEAQAYFWNYSSRKARAKAIRARTGRDDADVGGGDA